MNFNPFSKQQKVRCPDGVRFVYKNADDAFPLFAKDYKTRVEAAANAIEGLNGQLGVEFSSHISGLLVQFDAASNSIQLLFRNAYEIFYKTNPCGGWEILVSEARQIITNEDRHRQILLEVERIRAVAAADPANHGAIEQAFQQGITSLAESPRPQQATERMAATEAKAAEWDEVSASP